MTTKMIAVLIIKKFSDTSHQRKKEKKNLICVNKTVQVGANNNLHNYMIKLTVNITHTIFI